MSYCSGDTDVVEVSKVRNKKLMNKKVHILLHENKHQTNSKPIAFILKIFIKTTCFNFITDVYSHLSHFLFSCDVHNINHHLFFLFNFCYFVQAIKY